MFPRQNRTAAARLAPALALTLFLAACASETRAPVGTPPPVASANHQHGRLIGLAAPGLAALFGTPALQVREGPGLKLQYRGGGCVLDAFLYPPASGPGTERVTYVDARATSGAPTNSAACEAAIEASR